MPLDRTWQNLQASRQTELTANDPLHTVCEWIGNTKAMAAGHDLQINDAGCSRKADQRGRNRFAYFEPLRP